MTWKKYVNLPVEVKTSPINSWMRFCRLFAGSPSLYSRWWISSTDDDGKGGVDGGGTNLQRAWDKLSIIPLLESDDEGDRIKIFIKITIAKNRMNKTAESWIYFWSDCMKSSDHSKLQRRNFLMPMELLMQKEDDKSALVCESHDVLISKKRAQKATKRIFFSILKN